MPALFLIEQDRKIVKALIFEVGNIRIPVSTLKGFCVSA
jgi:hypothetical protein